MSAPVWFAVAGEAGAWRLLGQATYRDDHGREVEHDWLLLADDDGREVAADPGDVTPLVSLTMAEAHARA